MIEGSRAGILATGDRWHVERLAEALRRRGCEPLPLPMDRLSGRAGGPGPAAVDALDAPLDGLDALLVRFIPEGSLDQIVFRVDALHALHDAGLPVVNPPRAIERTVDKHWTSQLLARASIPTPATVAAENVEDALAAFRRFGDVVVKPLLGSGGRGIVRVTDEDLAHRVFRALRLQRAVFYVQEFVPHGRSDLRLLVAGGRVVAAARREADGWKTNVAAGGVMRPHRPAPAEEDLALRAARAVGADYAGVDLLERDDGALLVAEVNGIPGWSALQRTTSIDLAGEIAAIVLAKIAARRAALVPGR